MASSFTDGPSPETRQEQFEQGVAISLHLWQSLTIAVQNHWGGPDSSDKRDWLAGVIVDLFPNFVDLAAASSTSSATTITATTSATITPNTTTTVTTTAKSQPKNTNENTSLKPEPIAQDIEDTLLQVLFDEFEADVDDQSEAQVADRVLKCRAQCAAGDFSLVEELRARWLEAKGKRVVAQSRDAPDQDTDWDESGSSDDDDDGDEHGGKNGGGGGGEDVDMSDAPDLVPVAPREKPQPEIDEDGFEKVSRRRR
ncbi:Pre-rRNA-processing protein TSR2-domain-containing protein [Nemania sp. FL0916]|nr:Pre-rRNA-processing protein TSR2-domain-containing protein [Nemania sp. FL0916]